MKKISILLLLLAITGITGLVHAQQWEQRADGFYKDGQLYTGTYETSHSNGQPESVRNFVNGLEDGASNYYNEGGKLIEIRAWNIGKKHGTWLKFTAEGQKTGEANYVNDVKQGKWFIWDEKGTLRYEMHYTDGRKTGNWYMWDENGKLIGEKQY